jgi:hypothetical protein
MAVSGQVQHGYAWHGYCGSGFRRGLVRHGQARLDKAGRGFQGTVCKGETGCGKVRLGMGFVVLCGTVRLGGLWWGEGFKVWLGSAWRGYV